MKTLKFKTAKELKAVCKNIRSNISDKWLFSETDIISVNGITTRGGASFEVNKHGVDYYSPEKQGKITIRPPYVIVINK